MLYSNFDDALVAFRRDGGAMVFHGATGAEPSRWEVTDDLAGLAETLEVSPKQATEAALAAGGMDDFAIAAELWDWVS